MPAAARTPRSDAPDSARGRDSNTAPGGLASSSAVNKKPTAAAAAAAAKQGPTSPRPSTKRKQEGTAAGDVSPQPPSIPSTSPRSNLLSTQATPGASPLLPAALVPPPSAAESAAATTAAVSAPPNFKRFVPNITAMCESRGRVFSVWEADVSVLFVDLSGYSRVAAAMAAQGPHALFAAVNGYFDRIIDVTHEYGGDVITFAGDAMIAMWWVEGNPKAAAHLAARAAEDIQKRCGTHNVCDTKGNELQLRCHIGLSYGPLAVDVLSDPTVQNMQQNFVFSCGKASEDIRFPVDAAKATEIACTGEFMEVCGGEAVFTGVIPVSEEEIDFSGAPKVFKFSTLKAELTPIPPNTRTLTNASFPDVGSANASQKNFLHPRFVELLDTAGPKAAIAELRYLAVLFIKKTSNVPVATWFAQVFPTLDKQNCSIVQILDDDKGVHIVAAHNLFATDSSDIAGEAISTCAALLNLNAGVAIGASCGTVFCGLVGSHRAARWDITGNTCVRAARIMQYAETVGSSCGLDETIYQASVDITQLRTLATDVTLKGWPAPSTVYGITTEYDRAARLLYAPAANPCSAVNGEAMRVVQTVLQSQQQVKACVVSGEPGSGKKTVFAAAIKKQHTDTTIMIHRTRVNDPTLGIVSSIADWFARCSSPALSEAALAVRETMANRQYVQAHLCGLELITAVLAAGVNLTVIVDNAAALDKSSVAFIADTLGRNQELSKLAASVSLMQSVSRVPSMLNAGRRGSKVNMSRSGSRLDLREISAEDDDPKSASETPGDPLARSVERSSGSLFWAVSHTPLFGQPDAEAMRVALRSTKRPVSVPVATLRPMKLKECETLWNASAAWKSGAGCAEALHLKSGGNPGCMLATWAHFRSSVQKAMKQRKEGKDVPLVGQPASEGVMYVSDQSKMDLAAASWFALDAGICGRLLRLYDAVTAELRICLRVVAAVVYNDEMLSTDLIYKVLRERNHSMDRDVFTASISFLCDLYILRQNGAGECGYRLPAMQEVVLKLQPPDELLLAAKTVSALIAQSPDYTARTRPLFFVTAANIAKRAGDETARRERLLIARELCANGSSSCPSKSISPALRGGSRGPGSPADSMSIDFSDIPTTGCPEPVRVAVATELERAGIEPNTGEPYEVPPPPATVEQQLKRYDKSPMPMPILGMKNWQPPFVLGALAGELLGLKKHILQTYLHFARGGDPDAAPAKKRGVEATQLALDEIIFQRSTIETLVPRTEKLADGTTSGGKAFAEDLYLLRAIIESPLESTKTCVEAAKLFISYTTEHLPALVKHVRQWAATVTDLPSLLSNAAPLNEPWRQCIKPMMKPATELRQPDLCATVLDMQQLGWQPLYDIASSATLTAECLRDRTATLVDAKACLLTTLLAMATRGDFSNPDVVTNITDEAWAPSTKLTPAEGRRVALSRMQSFYAWNDISRRVFPDPVALMQDLAPKAPEMAQLAAGMMQQPPELVEAAMRGMYGAMDEVIARYIAWRPNPEIIAPLTDWIAGCLRQMGPPPPSSSGDNSGPPPTIEEMTQSLLHGFFGAMASLAGHSEGRFVDCMTACGNLTAAALDRRRWGVCPKRGIFILRERLLPN